MLRAKLKTKLKNTRHRYPERFSTLQKKPKGGKQSAKVGLPNYHAAPTDEGAETQAAYKLKSQLGEISEEVKRSLKNETFALRRQLLTGSQEPLKEIRRRFPWLFTEDEVSTYFTFYPAPTYLIHCRD